MADAREIAKWCEETHERRAQVMRQIRTLEALGGGKPAMLIAEAQRQVWERRDRAPAVPPGGARRWLRLEARDASSWAIARRIASGELTLEAITVDAIEAATFAAAFRYFQRADPRVRKLDVVLESEFLELVLDLQDLRALIPDPLARGGAAMTEVHRA